MTGDAELDRSLQQLIDDGESNAKSINAQMRKACRAAVKEIVLPAARARLGKRTGYLRGELVVRAQKRSRKSIGYWVGFADGSRPGSNDGTHYGWYIEFGTKPRQKKSGQNTGQITADSFLRISLYPNEAVIVAKVRAFLAAWIEQANQMGNG